MKVKFLQFIFAFLICFTFCIFAFAQQTSVALKFDEFTDSAEKLFYSDNLRYPGYEKLTFSMHIERFIKQLKNEPGSKAYVIYYQARISDQDEKRTFLNGVNQIKYKVVNNDRIKFEEVVIIDGGYREKNTVEFWIAPKNAAAPKPTPTLDKSETFVCPNIYISADVPLDKAETIEFNLYDTYLKEFNGYTLKWKVTGGEIFRGQGMNKIGVKFNNPTTKIITAFLEVDGLPLPCQKVSTVTAEVRGKLYLLDNFGPATNGEIKARLDSFMSSINSNSMAKGYIVIYGSRAEGERYMLRREKVIRDALRFRRYDESRLTFVRGGYREKVSTDLWVSLDNAESPKPTSTIDEKFVKKFVQSKKIPRRKQ